MSEDLHQDRMYEQYFLEMVRYLDIIAVCDGDSPQQRMLKAEILQHEREAAVLSSRLNSRLPVFRLPPEILAEIFLFQAAIVREEQISRLEELERECITPFYGWTNVSQVCSSWRGLALSLSSLWNWLALDHRTEAAYISLLANRSRGLPLSCVLNATDRRGAHCPQCMSMDRFESNMYGAISQLKALLPRIRELSIYVDRDEPHDMWDTFDEPAEALEVLRIEAYGSSRFVQGDTHPAWIAVPSQIFNHEVPQLRSLVLSGVQFRLSSPLLGPSLRHLEIIACQCVRPNERSNLGRFLKALEQLPWLETLCLDWSIIARDGDSFQPVSLQHLKALHVIPTTPSLLYAIVSHLHIPPSATVSYACPSSDPIDQREKNLLSAIATRLLQNMTIVAVRCCSTYSDDEQGSRSRCHIQVAPDAADSTARVRTSIERLVFEGGRREIFITDLLQSLDLSGVRDVHFDATDVMEWLPALRRAENVMSIKASGIFTMCLLAALATRVPQADDPQPHADSTQTTTVSGDLPDQQTSENNLPPPIFPHLSTLTIEDVQLGPAPSGGRDTLPTIPLEALWETQQADTYGCKLTHLLTSLELRRYQGATDINRVDFRRCMCEDMTQLVPLARAVGLVHWDGRVVRAE
ncbi:hypothetical protein GY45DRAFT_476071 [Cubamyces sp. BRFM 1775]|nr:hypothetical protein GY45DRAFT_476071 [Cubamyces sp. BRFM 1775]